MPSGTFGVQPGVELCTVNSHGEVVGAWMAESSPPSATTYLPAHGTFANCWSAPDWFLPAMVMSRAKDSHTAVLYRGRASEDGHDDEVLRFYRVPDEGDSGFWRNLTLVEVHLDRQTLLPDSESRFGVARLETQGLSSPYRQRTPCPSRIFHQSSLQRLPKNRRICCALHHRLVANRRDDAFSED